MSLYDAFISYSHAKDKPLGSALQSVMQRLGKPWYRRRALRVFRDDTSLAATPELWPALEGVLGQSRYIILLASPQFARSKWCGMEVAHWLQHKSVETILIGLTEGELLWDQAANDFVWDDTTPLPPVLKGHWRHEPKWIDLRPFRAEPDARDQRFVAAAADLAAAVHGKPKEDLLSQELREQRRALRLAWSAAAVLLALAGVAAWQWAEAVSQRTIAQAQRDRAERALSTATDTANTLLFDLAREFRDRKDIPASLIRLILDRARALQQQLSEAGETDPRLRYSAMVALGELSRTFLDLGDQPAALEAAERAHATLMALLQAEPNNRQWRRDLAVSFNRIGYVKRLMGRRDEALAHHRESLALSRALAGEADPHPEARRDVSVTLAHIADVMVDAGRRGEALALTREALLTTEALAEAAPGNERAQRDLAVGYQRLGDLLLLTAQHTEALDAYRKSMAIRETLAAANPGSATTQRDLSTSLDRFGDALAQAGQAEAALTLFRRSLSIREELVRADPQNVRWQLDLSIILNKIGDALTGMQRLEEALASYQRSVVTTEALVVRAPEDLERLRALAIGLNKIGDTLFTMRRLGEALENFRRSQTIREKLAMLDPRSVQAQDDLTHGFDRIGDVERLTGRPSAALDAYRRSLAIRADLAAQDPANAHLQRVLALSHNRIGDVHGDLDQHEEALAAHKRALEILARLARLAPTNLQAQWDLWFTHMRVGGAEAALARLDDAHASYAAGLAIIEPRATAPESRQWRGEMALTLEKIADVLARFKRFEQARAAVQRAIDIHRQIVEAAGANDGPAQLALAGAHHSLATVSEAAGETEAALAAAREATDIMVRVSAREPRDLHYRYVLGQYAYTYGTQLLRLQRSAEARAPFGICVDVRKALFEALTNNDAYRVDLAWSYEGLGLAEEGAGDANAALAAYGAGFALAEPLMTTAPRVRRHQLVVGTLGRRLGDILVANGRPAEAVAPYRRLLAILEAIVVAEPANVVWRKQLVLALVSLAKVGDEPRLRLLRALDMTRRLAAEGALAADEQSWPAAIEQALEQHPS